MSSIAEQDSSIKGLLNDIATSLNTLQRDHTQLASVVDGIQGKVNVLTQVKEVARLPQVVKQGLSSRPDSPSSLSRTTAAHESPDHHIPDSGTLSNAGARRTSLSSKITLTSYPGQAGVDSIPLHWGSPNPSIRGPVVVARGHGTIGRRNGRKYPVLYLKEA